MPSVSFNLNKVNGLRIKQTKNTNSVQFYVECIEKQNRGVKSTINFEESGIKQKKIFITTVLYFTVPHMFPNAVKSTNKKTKLKTRKNILNIR